MVPGLGDCQTKRAAAHGHFCGSKITNHVMEVTFWNVLNSTSEWSLAVFVGAERSTLNDRSGRVYSSKLKRFKPKHYRHQFNIFLYCLNNVHSPARMKGFAASFLRVF